MERISLCNSVFLNKVEVTKFKTNFVCINFIIPLDNENASKAALLAYVLKHGCKAYPGISEIASRSSELYGAEIDIAIRKKGDAQIISFYIDYVNPFFIPGNPDINAMSLDLLKNVVFNPLIENGSFSKDYVDIEKHNLIDIINSLKNNKTSYARKRCAQLVAEGHPFSICEYGDIDVLSRIDENILADFYEFFINNASVEIFAVGDFGKYDIASAFNGVFADNKDRLTVNSSSVVAKEYRSVIEHEMVEQAKLSLGYVYDGDFSAVELTLFLLLFAASPNSMLFMNVREKMSLCYYCSATVAKLKKIMVVYSGVLPEKLSVAENEIKHQLDMVAKGEFTKEDFEAAKIYYHNSLNSVYDSALSIEEFYFSKTFQHDNSNIDDIKKEIDNCSMDKMSEIALSMKQVITYTLLNGEQ